MMHDDDERPAILVIAALPEWRGLVCVRVVVGAFPAFA